MKKWDGPSRSWPTPHTTPLFLRSSIGGTQQAPFRPRFWRPQELTRGHCTMAFCCTVQRSFASTQTLRHKRTLSPSLLLSLHVSSCLIPPNPAPGLILQPRFVTKNEQISLSLSLFPSISLSRSSLPIRNPCELRGLCRHSYFGPRTFGGGITNVIEVSGLSIRVSPSHP